MNSHEFFKDYLPPMATLIAASTAAVVTIVFSFRQAKLAELQSEIALDKLKFDTLEKRLTVMYAARDLAILAVKFYETKKIDDDEFVRLKKEVIDGQFLFRNETNDYLTDIVHDCMDVTIFRSKYGESGLQSLSGEHKSIVTDFIKSEHQAFIRLSRKINEIPKVLKHDLSLNLLKETTSANSRSIRSEAIRIQTRIALCNVLLFLLALILFVLAVCAIASSPD